MQTSLILPHRQPQARTMPSPEPSPVPPVVLIGCGAVGRLFYQPALLELVRRRELRVAALVDPVASARAALGEFFPDAQLAAALNEVTAGSGLLAIVASPPRYHAAHCLEAFARGWHVLCEKPMAMTAPECAAIQEAATIHDRLLGVGLYKRFFPSSVVIREICRGGALGALRRFEVHEGGPFRWPAASPSFFSKMETSGGVLLDIGVHVLDLLLYWCGEPKELDYADDAMGGLEANAVVQLKYAGGATGRVQLSRDWKTRQRYRFEFERGVVEWGVNEANALTIELKGLPAALQGTLVDAARVPAWTNPQCFIAQIQNLLAAIRGDEPVRVTGEDGARVQQLITTCYARRRWLEQPWLEIAEAVRARQIAASS